MVRSTGPRAQWPGFTPRLPLPSPCDAGLSSCAGRWGQEQHLPCGRHKHSAREARGGGAGSRKPRAGPSAGPLGTRGEKALAVEASVPKSPGLPSPTSPCHLVSSFLSPNPSCLRWLPSAPSTAVLMHHRGPGHNSTGALGPQPSDLQQSHCLLLCKARALRHHHGPLATTRRTAAGPQQYKYHETAAREGVMRNGSRGCGVRAILSSVLLQICFC